MMDNPRVIVVGRGQALFLLAMHIAFKLHGERTEAKYWWNYKPDAEENRNVIDRVTKLQLLGVDRTSEMLVLSWGGDEKYKNVLPAFMDCEAASSFAWNWLNRQEYPPQPDHDGSNAKGFIVFNEASGHIGPDHYGIVAVGPAWAMLGK